MRIFLLIIFIFWCPALSLILEKAPLIVRGYPINQLVGVLLQDRLEKEPSKFSGDFVKAMQANPVISTPELFKMLSGRDNILKDPAALEAAMATLCEEMETLEKHIHDPNFYSQKVEIGKATKALANTRNANQTSGAFHTRF